jgi:hypothetical protein
LSAPTVSTRLAWIAFGAARCHALGRGTAWATDRKVGADEPYEGILHVRVCGGRRGQPRLLPGSEQPPRFAVRESEASAMRSGGPASRALSRRGGCRSVLTLCPCVRASRANPNISNEQQDHQMKTKVRAAISVAMAIATLAFASTSFAQITEERRAAARQRAEEALRFLNEQMPRRRPRPQHGRPHGLPLTPSPPSAPLKRRLRPSRLGFSGRLFPGFTRMSAQKMA